MKHLKSLLRALQIFDRDNKLSLTSLALMVIIVKLAVAPTLDWTVITVFFISLLNYNAKKLINKSSDDKNTIDIERITGVEEAIKNLKNMIALKK
jgi:hypothetical protein